MPKITVEELSNRLARLHLEIVAFIVHDRETGLVVAPSADELARACAWLRGHADEARAFGRAGRELAQAVTWDACIDRLLAAVA